MSVFKVRRPPLKGANFLALALAKTWKKQLPPVQQRQEESKTIQFNQLNCRKKGAPPARLATPKYSIFTGSASLWVASRCHTFFLVVRLIKLWCSLFNSRCMRSEAVLHVREPITKVLFIGGRRMDATVHILRIRTFFSTFYIVNVSNQQIMQVLQNMG